MPIADFTLGDALLTVLEIFVLMAWFWILITIIGDLFRDHEQSGWAKAGWVVLLILVPFLGALIYLIARGEGMRDRPSVSKRRRRSTWTPISARPPAARRSTSSPSSATLRRRGRSPTPSSRRRRRSCWPNNRLGETTMSRGALAW
jgi:ABC-type transport system involved in cytochrome bd biosynthesis fused ATPase/permease subunit